ncbi:hypothetical protein AB3X91_40460 [Paraburkholderia sp. BR14263]|uniref:hypothetical protein n=1 Tax=unclassified Paraburkholderia TaxID=2615204 RepID=UPI0034CFF7EF
MWARIWAGSRSSEWVSRPTTFPFGATRPQDNGRANVTKESLDCHAFKTPTLRNVELTAPYFYDGRGAELHAAVRDMATYQVGRRLPQCAS